MLVEALLGWLVTVGRVLRRALLRGVVVLLARVEIVNFSAPRITVLCGVVAVSLTLLVVATDDVSVVNEVFETMRAHLLPLIFFAA